jgi:hypothetical protein
MQLQNKGKIMAEYTVIVPVIDKTQTGHHYTSKDGSIKIIKNENASWVIYKNEVQIEMYGVASNAVAAAERMVQAK